MNFLLFLLGPAIIGAIPTLFFCFYRIVRGQRVTYGAALAGALIGVAVCFPAENDVEQGFGRTDHPVAFILTGLLGLGFPCLLGASLIVTIFRVGDLIDR